MRRRQLLLSTFVLLFAPAFIHAGAQSKRDDADVVFADFESGTYDGWTLTGNCWGAAPVSEATFPGKITGFLDKYYLSTYSAKLGNAAIGRAVSQDFTIEKPFIKFLIGGGDYPGEACINLVIADKVIFSTTGNNRPELHPDSWDVSKWIGKKARIEVVDDTQAAARGYIMVDDIRFSQVGPTGTVSTSVKSAADPDVLPVWNTKIVKYCASLLGSTVGDGECSTLATEALANAGARSQFPAGPAADDYVWGDYVCKLEVLNGHVTLDVGEAGKKPGGGKRADVRPGDIIQYRGVEFYHQSGSSYAYQRYPHHTAVVKEVSPNGSSYTVFEQNVRGTRIVVITKLYLSDLTQGWMRIYRPTPKDE